MKKVERLYGEEIIRFGRWRITKKGMLYNTSKGFVFIDKQNLWQVHKDRDGDKWELPIAQASKDWIKNADLYQFNTAFFFAQDYFKKYKPAGLERISAYRTLQVAINIQEDKKYAFVPC